MDVNTPTGAAGAGNDSAALALLPSVPKTRIVQNVGTNVLVVRYGLGAGLSLYHVALKPGLVVGDGLGGVLIVTRDKWSGPLSWTGVGAQVVVTRFT